MNYYEVLNISSDADKQQVKRAYFSMVKTHSPDKDPEGFKAVRLAYETLFDEKKRAEYDTYFGASEDIQNELLAARELIRQNKYKEAVDFLTEFSKKTAAPEVIRLNIEALLLYGKPGKAQTLCKALLEENPQDIETLLLCAKISTSRGHTVRADHYYKDAIAIDSHNPKVWIDYIQYSRQHQPWMLSDIGIRAIQIDQDMFRDNYGMYLHVVCGLIDPEISLFEDAQYNERIMMRAFEKFTEYFIADKNPDEITYQNALGAITHVINEPEYLPHIEKLMSALEKCRHHDSNDKDYIDMYAFMIRQKLHVNERIHDVLADLTGYFISGENDRDAQLSMECYIVMELPAIRKDIKVFRDEYPEYFKLHQQFYLDVLNERKTEFLTTKYFSICKRIMRNPGLFDDMEHEEDNIISADSEEPYVREAPKIGRNAPCPCGSGKKYKKCCG